jgi:hypothetical protein
MQRNVVNSKVAFNGVSIVNHHYSELHKGPGFNKGDEYETARTGKKRIAVVSDVGGSASHGTPVR